MPDSDDGSPSNPSPPGSCLILHGLGGGPYEASPLIDAITSTGLPIESPVYPGHEGPGPWMPRSSWQEWFETVSASFDRLNARSGPVAVIGFSTGGTLALHLAAHRTVDRLALLAPFLGVRRRWYYGFRPELYLATLGRVVRQIPRRRSCVSDPIRRREVERQVFFRSFNLDAARSAIDLIRIVRAEVPSIMSPALIVQSPRDSVVDPGGSRWLYHHLGTPESARRLLWLERSDHLVAMDVERDLVIEEVLRFLGLPTRCG